MVQILFIHIQNLPLSSGHTAGSGPGVGSGSGPGVGSGPDVGSGSGPGWTHSHSWHLPPIPQSISPTHSKEWEGCGK